MSGVGTYATGAAVGPRAHRHPHPRLLPARNGHALCGVKLSEWKDSGRASAPAPPSRVVEVSPSNRKGGTARCGRASDFGQLRDPQTPEGAALVGATATLPSALHADERVVAQFGGTVLSGFEPRRGIAGQLCQPGRVDGRHLDLSGRTQLEATALRMARGWKSHPGEDLPRPRGPGTPGDTSERHF